MINKNEKYIDFFKVKLDEVIERDNEIESLSQGLINHSDCKYYKTPFVSNEATRILIEKIFIIDNEVAIKEIIRLIESLSY